MFGKAVSKRNSSNVFIDSGDADYENVIAYLKLSADRSIFAIEIFCTVLYSLGITLSVLSVRGYRSFFD